MRANTERRLRRAVARRAGCEGPGYGEVDVWCAYCNLWLVVGWEGREPEFLTGDSREQAHLDHVIPECRNGPTSLDNTVIACAPCNAAKGASPFGDPDFLTWLSERRVLLLAGVQV